MTLTKLIGGSIGLSQTDFRGLEGRMVFDWLKRKVTGADIEFDPTKRENMKGIAAGTAAIALGGAGVLATPTEAQAGKNYKLASAVVNAPIAVQNAYKYILGLEEYQDGTGTTSRIAAEVIMGRNTRPLNITRVTEDEHLTSPVARIVGEILPGPTMINPNLINKAVAKGNVYCPNLFLGIKSIFSQELRKNGRDVTQGIRHFAYNVFEIAALEPEQFETINSVARTGVVYDTKKSIEENNYRLADVFNQLPLDKREWILNDIVWNHIKHRVKVPVKSEEFNFEDLEGLKWKNFYFSLGLLAITENAKEDEKNKLGIAFNKENNIYDKINGIFHYHTLSAKLLGLNLYK